MQSPPKKFRKNHNNFFGTQQNLACCLFMEDGAQARLDTLNNLMGETL